MFRSANDLRRALGLPTEAPALLPLSERPTVFQRVIRCLLKRDSARPRYEIKLTLDLDCVKQVVQSEIRRQFEQRYRRP